MPYKEGKKWRACVMFDGMRYASLQSIKKEAIEWEIVKRKELKAGEKQRSELDCLNLCAKYLDYATRFTKKVYKEKDALCKRVLSSWGPSLPVSQITSGLILKYLTIQKQNRSANASNKDRKNLLAMFSFAVKYLEIRHNPVVVIEKFPHDRKPQYTPSEKDILKVIAASTREERVFLSCYLQTGARRSEIFRWNWNEDINFDKREVRLGTRKTKDGSMLYEWLPMSDELYENLWWWFNNRSLKSVQHVFVVLDKRSPHYGKPYTTRRKFLSGLCKRAGVKPFGFHALRRYVASVLADTHKVSAKTIQRILRHKSVTTTERYIQNINKDLAETMNLLSNEDAKKQLKELGR
jgi:integrase